MTTKTRLSTGRSMRVLAGLVILVLALPPFFSFPRLDFWLVAIAAIYLFFLLLFPRLWLFVLPLATVSLDLTPYTGRFGYNELDLLFIVTLASGLLYDRYRFRVYAPTPAIIVLLLYLLVLALGFAGWRYLALPPQASFDNPYYTSEYAYKVFKGLLWGVLLVPMWGYLLARHKHRAVDSLVTGMCLAALLLGLIVLWERGTLGVILSGSAWYHILNSLLDLSSSYRVTGIFSDMHTGGEAYDGVLLLLLPVTLYAAVYGRLTWIRLLGVAGTLTLAYLTLVGFTRTTYAAFAVSLGLFGALVLWSRRSNRLPFPFPLLGVCVSLGAGSIAAILAYRVAGSYGLASYAALILLACGVSLIHLPGRWRHAASALAVVLCAMGVNAHFNSRWAETSYFWAFMLALSLGASYLLGLNLFKQFNPANEINRFFVLAAVVLMPCFLAFALGGYQMNERAGRVSKDLDTRENHWHDVIASSGSSYFQQWFGNGVGSFPVSYIDAHPERVQEVGSFMVSEEEGRNILRLGAGHDLRLGQRVTIHPFTNHTVTVRLRSQQASRLAISLCERNIIYASNFMPNCVTKNLRFESTGGAFAVKTVEINSARIGERGALSRWPTLMTIAYGKAGTVLEIDSIDISADGFSVLQNNSFNDGLDYWFSYNDFAHLPWHVKNTFLQIWFESGWLGLALFVSLLAFLVSNNFNRHAHDSLLPVYTTGVISLCIFGIFGSPLDSARVSWMFYFFLAAGMANFRVRTVA